MSAQAPNEDKAGQRIFVQFVQFVARFVKVFSEDEYMINSNRSRREFFADVPVLAAAAFWQAPASVEPILDIHQHILYSGRTPEQTLAHQMHYGIKTTVLLPGAGWLVAVAGTNRDATAFQAQHPDRFVTFASSDPA